MENQSCNMVIQMLNLVVLSLTLLAVAWYALTAKRQVDELIHQRNLSIMPALSAQLIPIQGGQYDFQLTNIGNGSALNVKLEKVKSCQSREDSYFLFHRVPIIRSNESIILTYEEYLYDNRIDKDKSFLFTLHEHHAEIEVPIYLTFQDIEGNKYKQNLFLGKGGYEQGFVKLVKGS